MAGIKITKKYVATTTPVNNLANNWSVLVYGVTDKGTYENTLVQNYTEDFLPEFGDPVADTRVLTHRCIKTLLDNGVPVIFRRLNCQTGDVTNASYTYKSGVNNLFTLTAKDSYVGELGNNLKIELYYNDGGAGFFSGSFVLNTYDNNGNRIDNYSETLTLDTETGEHFIPSFGIQLYNILNNIRENDLLKYLSVTDILENKPDIWKTVNGTEQDPGGAGSAMYYYLVPTASDADPVALTGGVGSITNNLDNALTVLKDQDSDIYKDVKLLNAPTYYPQLRFVTTAGLCDPTDTDSTSAPEQDKVNEALGKFAQNCKSSFRVLIDYNKSVTDNITTFVRNFAKSMDTKSISPALFAYFGYWGSDNTPGSVGFLTAIARAGYNVYSRRLAGAGFSPSFTKPYKEIYIDALEDWQASDKVRLNPIMTIDAEGNIAVMGSSTLASPEISTVKDPKTSLDILCVGDYIAALLNGIALQSLNVAFDRLSLSSISNRMSQTVERFVTSGAITRYDFNFDLTQLGKLGVECILYFAINLEEVALTITSVYDTELLS